MKSAQNHIKKKLRGKNLPVLLGLVLILAIPITVYSVLSIRDDRSRASLPAKTEEQQLQKLTIEILEKSKDKKASMSELKNLVKQRKQKLLNLSETNPGEVIKNAYSSKIIQELPSEIQTDLESQVTLTGEIEVSHSDNFEQNISRFYYGLTIEGGEKYNLFFAKRDPQVLTGSRIKVKATKIADKLFIDDGQSSDFEVTQRIEKVLPAATTKKVAVILFNHQNNVVQPYTPDSVRATLLQNSNSVKDYFLEASYDLYTLQSFIRTDGDVFGWYTIPFNNSPCESSTADWRVPARTAASADGFNINNYTQVIYAFPSTSACGYAGKAVVNGQSSWINGSFSPGVVSHELGHNFGPGHASTYRCTSGGVNVAISNTCTKSEYGDPFDVMGNSGRRNHFNNFHKGRIGWYNPSNTQTVTTNGVYTIAPVEQFTNNVQVLRIPRGLDQAGNPSNYYYIEYRQPFGYDNYATNDPVVKGVSIRIAPNYNTYENTLLIDNTPTTTSFLDSSLQLNQTFTDTAYGISVTTKSISSQSSTVQVSFANQTCVRVNPTVTISPVTQWTTSTGSLTYLLSVTNNDNASCGNSTFTGVFSSQASLQQTPANPSLVIAPGATANTNIIISPISGNLSPGLYSFSERVINMNFDANEGSANANYNVSTPVAKPGDVNGDNLVNITDLNLIINNWAKTDSIADINRSGKVDFGDLTLVINNWGT